MKRIHLFSSVLIAGSFFASAAMPSAASVYDEARKVCNDRFSDEQKSGSVPKGMSKERYLGQCQRSYVRSVKLESELNDADNDFDGSEAQSKDGQGGPEILPPQAASAKGTRKAAVKPLPRFKPTI